MEELKDRPVLVNGLLGRNEDFDDRSWNYPVLRMLTPAQIKKPRSYTWRLKIILDQGREGACVGFAFVHEALARPMEVIGLDAQFAKTQVYWPAQRIDPYAGGAYPGAKPFSEGTSILAGVKTMVELGFYSSYHWAFSLEEMILAVGYGGPCVLGVNWHEGMFEPDANGFIHVDGPLVGGHAILCVGVNLKGRYFLLANSWGPKWGPIGGFCKISFDDMAKLLKARGEVCCVKRQKRK